MPVRSVNARASARSGALAAVARASSPWACVTAPFSIGVTICQKNSETAASRATAMISMIATSFANTERGPRGRAGPTLIRRSRRSSSRRRAPCG